MLVLVVCILYTYSVVVVLVVWWPGRLVVCSVEAGQLVRAGTSASLWLHSATEPGEVTTSIHFTHIIIIIIIIIHHHHLRHPPLPGAGTTVSQGDSWVTVI